MSNKFTALIVVLVVVVVVVGSLFAAGILSLPTSSTNSSTSGSPGAPNVVNSSTVSKAYGVTWQQNTGSSGQISSSHGLQDLMNSSSGSSIPLSVQSSSSRANGLLGDLAANGYPSAVAAPSVSGNSPLNDLVAFEMGIFSPAGKNFSFSSVGFLQYSSSSLSANIFHNLSANVTNSSVHTNGAYSNINKGTYNNSEFVYASSYATTTTYYNNSSHIIYTYPYANVDTAALVGLYKQFIIYIFYMSPVNLSLLKAETLFAAQANVAASVSVSQSSTFVSSSTLAINLAGSWSQDITVGVAIHNATTLLNDYLNFSASNSGSASGISASHHRILNETLGNITDLGVSLYTSPSSGNITEIGAVGYVTFTDHAAANFTFTTLTVLALASGSSMIGTGNVSGYSYLNLSSHQLNYSGYTTYTSVVAVQYKNFIVFELFTGNMNLKLSQLKSVASAEINVA